MSKKVSIILPYYNRKKLLIETLNSYNKFYSKYNFEIIIVDDSSRKPEQLYDIPSLYKSLDIKVIRIDKKKNKTEVNPCLPYNIGVRYSSGDILILSSPETFHTNDIFKLCNNFEELNDEKYYLFSVFCCTNEKLKNNIIENNYNIDEKIINLFNQNMSKDIYFNKYGSWYLHGKYKDSKLNFLTALTRNNYYKLSGFDERFRYGTGFDDNEFLNRLKLIINNFVYFDDCYAIHANHSVSYHIKRTTNRTLYKKKLKYKENDNWGKSKYIKIIK